MIQRSHFSALFLVLTVLIASPGVAESLDTLRSSGAIGERFDGFAVARDPDATETVERINTNRTKIYERRAKEQGVSVSTVGIIYAKEIFQQAPNGTWFLKEDGNWIQK